MIVSKPISNQNENVTVGNYNYKRYREMQAKSSADKIESVFQSDIPANSMTAAEQLERFNLTAGYLLAVMRLIDEFTIIKVNGLGMTGKYEPGYYYSQWEILDTLMNIVACKLKPEVYQDFRGRLDNLLDRFERVFMQGADGVYIDKIEGIKIKRDLGKLFEDMLGILDKKGMLTFKSEDPTRAMSKFND